MPVDADAVARRPVMSDEAAALGRPLLRAHGISRHFEGMHAVDDVSIDVQPGRITGLIGPNGAGKSTFLAVLAGTLPASGGTITFDGADVTRMPAFQRARRGLVRTFQLPSEFAQLTVLENLMAAAPGNRGDTLFGALLGRRYWGDDEDRLVDPGARPPQSVPHVRQGVRLRELDERRPKALVEIMRALMLHPRFSSSTSRCRAFIPRSSSEIQYYSKTLRDGGLTILMVEHELHMVERLCDTVIVMAQGRSSEAGP